MSEYFEIEGGNPLYGQTTVHGAKNAVLPLMAMGILSDDTVTVCDCPDISDVRAMCGLLQNLGVRVELTGRRISVSGRANTARVSEAFCKDMRSSMFMLGALLASLGEVEMPLPGGCKIGSRPLDIHIDGLRRMGATAEYTRNGIRCYAKKLHGADVVLKFPSVGATENLIMCASLAQGKTTLVNVAREPEIISLAQGLRAMGARISGEGSSVIKIDGVDKLGGCQITPVGDRIVAGTLLSAVALCGGEVQINGVGDEYLGSVIDALRSKKISIDADECGMFVRSSGRAHPVRISTAPYPMFPTDMQPQLFAFACFADGVSCIKETVFENRFAHAKEFAKLGAIIRLENNVATVYGNSLLKDVAAADSLMASDLRGGAGLMIAALKINGKTNVFGSEYIDRGYESIEDVFCSLGGVVRRKTAD